MFRILYMKYSMNETDEINILPMFQISRGTLEDFTVN